MMKQLMLATAIAALPGYAFAGDMAEDTGMAMKDDSMAMEMMEGDAPMIHDAYARAATPNARSGAAFMVIMNPTDVDDRLIEARSDVAARVELHTHTSDENGVMQMREVEGGFVIPAGATHTLERGGDHVMFMGLKESFTQDKEIAVTFVFEQAGEIDFMIPVDLERQAGGHGGHAGHDHGGHDHNHGEMSN